jgi:hypothetical protein
VSRFYSSPSSAKLYHPSFVTITWSTSSIFEKLLKLRGKLEKYHFISFTMEHRVVIDFVIHEDEIIPIDIGTHDKVRR